MASNLRTKSQGDGFHAQAILGILFGLAATALYVVTTAYLSRSLGSGARSEALMVAAPFAISSLLSFGNAALIHLGRRLSLLAKAIPIIFFAGWVALSVLRRAL